MKKLTAFSLAALIFSATHVSAACVSIKDTYNGTVPANSEVIAYGPFTVTGANGCTSANISSTIAPLGIGSPPTLRIDRLVGSSWVEVAGNSGRNASFLGTLGTYRIRHINTLSVSLLYSGTTAYGR